MQIRRIELVLWLLTVGCISSCSDSDPGGTEPEVASVPQIEHVGDPADEAPAPHVPDPAEMAAGPAADSTPSPHEEDPTFTGTWEGYWDGQWRVLFEFGPQRKNGEMDVIYRWEERPGKPMNERRYIGCFSHGDVHLEPAIKTPKKKKITLVKIYPSAGETGIFAVGKFGKSRVFSIVGPLPCPWSSRSASGRSS